MMIPFFALFYIKRRKRDDVQKPTEGVPNMEAKMGKHEDIATTLSNDLSHKTETNADIGYINLNDKVQRNESEQLNDINIQTEKIQYNTARQINKTDFEIGKEIGKGNFGKVYKGEVAGLFQDKAKTDVAIKCSSGLTSKREIDDFMAEIKVMYHVNPHLNLVSMLGACTSELEKEGKIWLLLEFCKYGDLKNYLMKNKNRILNGKESDPINNRCILKWAHDIANGMKYLAENHVMHGDLAARNILMHENLLEGSCPFAKVADFGLSKKFYDNITYKKESRMFVPWKWMAFEYLSNDIFTLTSDVWSFGVLFWELLSFGRSPYGHQSYNEVLQLLENGYCLECPQEVKRIKSWSPQCMYKDISNACFERDCLKRAPFSKIVEIIQERLSSDELTLYQKMKDVYTFTNGVHYLDYCRQ